MMRFLLLFLTVNSLLFAALGAQGIYLPAQTNGEHGVVVSAADGSVYQLPAGFGDLIKYHQPKVVREWPVLFRKNNYREADQYAWLTEDRQWIEWTGYQEVWPVQDGRYRRKKDSWIELVSVDGQIIRDSLKILGPFHENGLAVAMAEVRNPYPKGLWGLLDTTGHWHWPPRFKRIAYVGHDRYLVQNNELQTGLLSTAGDTIVPFDFEDWKLRWYMSFDESGHVSVTLPDDRIGFMDVNGRLTADSIPESFGILSQGIYRHQREKQYSYLRYDGSPLNDDRYERALHFKNNRAAAEDPQSKLIGYLGPDGNWAIPPTFCSGTSFRHGLAITAQRPPGECPDRKYQSEPTGGQLSVIGQHERRDPFQVIDTTGRVLWSGLATFVYLLDPQLISVSYCHLEHAPAIELIWLEEGRSWYHPRFTITRWEETARIPLDKVYGIDLGIWRNIVIQVNRDHLYELPENFLEVTQEIGDLRSLGLRGHDVSAILADIMRMKELRSLNLSYCGLHELPKQIRRLRDLEELNLSNNHLTKLPRAIFRMKHLKLLNIAGNDFPPDLIPQLQEALPNTEVVYK